MTKDEILTEYAKVLRIKRLLPNTITTYMACVKMYLNWCEAHDIYPPDINEQNLRDFFITINANASLKQMRGTIGNLYKHVFNIPYILVGMPFPRQTASLPDYFTAFELLQIFQAVQNPKQRLILKIQYACALRVHEVVKIKWTDFVHGSDGFDLKIVGKGYKADYVPVPDETITELVQCLGNNFHLNEYVFKGQFKDFYSTRSVQIIINTAMARLNIHKQGSTHLLRHSRATHLLQAGASLRHIQILLRHKNSKTTEVYTHLNTSDLRKACATADIVLLQNNQKINDNLATTPQRMLG